MQCAPGFSRRWLRSPDYVTGHFKLSTVRKAKSHQVQQEINDAVLELDADVLNPVSTSIPLPHELLDVNGARISTPP